MSIAAFFRCLAAFAQHAGEIMLPEVIGMVRVRPDYLSRIVRDPHILVGKPTVRGTRIPVELVLKHLEENPDLADLFAAFPRLTEEDVKACLAYAREAVESKRPRSPRRESAVRAAQA